MMRRCWCWIALTGSLCGILVGCEKLGLDSAKDDDAAALAEFEASDSGSSRRERTANAQPAATEKLELRLKVGDRFPLIKTVEQRLRQWSAQGGPPVDSSSTLTLTLAIEVEDISDGVKWLGVRYQRVRYEHEIAGEKASYDSAIPRVAVPDAAQIYHGLADNGFSFMLGADQRIVKVLEFDAFLKRCARHAPVSQQSELLTRLVASTEDEGIANFVDDSVGLLPDNIDEQNAAGGMRVGDTWRKSRQVVRPIPMSIDTAYRLESLNERYATIELFGHILPAQIELVGNSPAQKVGLTEKMTLRSGHTFGNCTIDRKSGLPLQSRVTRQLDLLLELPSGARFQQSKEIVTSIHAFPEQNSPTTAGRGPGSTAAPELPRPTSRGSKLTDGAIVVPTGFER